MLIYHPHIPFLLLLFIFVCCILISFFPRNEKICSALANHEDENGIFIAGVPAWFRALLRLADGHLRDNTRVSESDKVNQTEIEETTRSEALFPLFGIC